VERQQLESSVDIQRFIQRDLEKVERLMYSQVLDFHPDLKAATEIILTAGGKRLRPRIILLIGKLLGTKSEPLISLAASIELLHNATLVHDDLIDGAMLRRGIPTLNANWSPAATVLAGDFLFAAASDLASKTNSLEVMSLFSRTLKVIVNGEINQLFLNRCGLSIEGYYERIYAKTASLFETSAKATALISHAQPWKVKLLRQFGYELGMAFQIVDDIFDYMGSETAIGKPVGGDLRQGLITLPLIYYLQMNPGDPGIQDFINRPQMQSAEDVERLRISVSKSDAIHKAYEQAALFAARAEACLLAFPDCPERAALLVLTRFIVEREK
jgi:geranylgeranyl pyrophosphate synthase